MSRSNQLVSFVVPTKNAGRTLEACLASIAAQDHPNVESIVVDNRSTDATVAIAKRCADLVMQHGPERSAQRNLGAARARGDVLVFLDADMVVEPSVAHQCLEALMANPRFGAAVIPELSFGIGYFARCRSLEKELYVGDDRVEAARAFRRDAFEAVGGYDRTLNAFEDWDIADRVRWSGWRIARVRADAWHDDGVVSPRRQFRKKRYYGSQSGRYLARRGTPRRRRVLRSSLWLQPRRLLERPWLVPGLVWLKACETVGILVGAAESARVAAKRGVETVVTGSASGPQILHVVGEFDAHEAIGRSIVHLVRHTPGEHHLAAARINTGAQHFASAHALGGSMATFPVVHHRRLASLVRRLSPDVIHLHGGPLISLWVPLRILRAPRRIVSIYAWPRLPALSALRRTSLLAAVRSQVLRPRIAVSNLLGGAGVARLLRHAGVRQVLTPDSVVVERLGRRGLDVHLVPPSVAPDSRRARLDQEHPVVVFAGRGETVRGIDTLLDAVPALRLAWPGVRVRLLLLYRPEAESIARMLARRGLADTVDVVIEPVADLRAAFTTASVAVFPFKFDHVTIPPALTVAEAMSVGLPVVGSDVTCITAIVRDGENGVVVPVNDPAGLASAIDALLKDRLRWDRLAHNATRTIERAAAGHSVEALSATLYRTRALGETERPCAS